MDNPLEQPAPDDPIARVHTFAYDLAWGAMNGKWIGHFRAFSQSDWIAMAQSNDRINKFSDNIMRYFESKWENNPPECSLLHSFGYSEPDRQNISRDGSPTFLLTQKAFALLEKPAIPPRIFISYRQKESSAFASLIEARLTLRDPTIGVFIDKQIEGGAKWLKRIEKEVRQCETFIIVYGPDTPNSDTIPLEIAWAEETESNIIPVLHNSFTRECKGYPEQFKALNDITVEKESAKAYENAITEILIALGYSTLQSPRPSSTSQ